MAQKLVSNNQNNILPTSSLSFTLKFQKYLLHFSPHLIQMGEKLLGFWHSVKISRKQLIKKQKNIPSTYGNWKSKITENY